MANVVAAIQALVAVFSPHCVDCDTLCELAELTQEHTRWGKAHDLFGRIRRKTLAAGRSANHLLETQYVFEEACAKTLYNLSRASAPFDPDIPFYIVTNALVLARRLNISDSEIVNAIMA